MLYSESNVQKGQLGSGAFAAENDVEVEGVVAIPGDAHVAATDGEAIATADPLALGKSGAAWTGGLETDGR